jgi:acyl-coenzyme A synthetase/AMP-(fatty) acid ligase
LLRTGDYGWLDADGYLYFTGRRDQLFKRRGMRMSTIEIEAAARDVPGVIDAVVVPPSHDRDAVIVAVTQLTSKQVLQALRERLNPEKVPTVCRIVTDIPRLPNGKIDRVAVSVALEGES